MASTVWRILAHWPCNTLKRWVDFSFCIKLFWTTAVSNCRRNTAQYVAPLNFGSLTVVILAPGPSPPSRQFSASTAIKWASSSRRVASISFRRSAVQIWRLHSPVVYQAFLQFCLASARHLFVFQAFPWLLSCIFPSCSPMHVLELWGQHLFCSFQPSAQMSLFSTPCPAIIYCNCFIITVCIVSISTHPTPWHHL